MWYLVPRYGAVDVDLGCWMKTVVPPTSTIVVIINKVPTEDVVVVVVWVLSFIRSTTGCHLTASSCYVVYSFLQTNKIDLD